MSAFAFEGDGDLSSAAPDHEVARELCGQLHVLALRYWSEGRPADALRVAMEAASILDSFNPPTDLVTQVKATVDAVGREVLAAPDADHRPE